MVVFGLLVGQSWLYLLMAAHRAQSDDPYQEELSFKDFGADVVTLGANCSDIWSGIPHSTRRSWKSCRFSLWCFPKFSVAAELPRDAPDSYTDVPLQPTQACG